MNLDLLKNIDVLIDDQGIILRLDHFQHIRRVSLKRLVGRRDVRAALNERHDMDILLEPVFFQPVAWLDEMKIWAVILDPGGFFQVWCYVNKPLVGMLVHIVNRAHAFASAHYSVADPYHLNHRRRNAWNLRVVHHVVRAGVPEHTLAIFVFHLRLRNDRAAITDIHPATCIRNSRPVQQSAAAYAFLRRAITGHRSHPLAHTNCTRTRYRFRLRRRMLSVRHTPRYRTRRYRRDLSYCLSHTYQQVHVGPGLYTHVGVISHFGYIGHGPPSFTQ